MSTKSKKSKKAHASKEAPAAKTSPAKHTPAKHAPAKAAPVKGEAPKTAPAKAESAKASPAAPAKKKGKKTAAERAAEKKEKSEARAAEKRAKRAAGKSPRAARARKMARHGGEGGHVPIEVIAGGVQKLANHLVERADDVNVALEEGKYANGQKFKERDEATLELVVKRGEVIKEFADLAKLPGKPVKPRAARYSRQNPGVRRAS